MLVQHTKHVHLKFPSLGIQNVKKSAKHTELTKLLTAKPEPGNRHYRWCHVFCLSFPNFLIHGTDRQQYVRLYNIPAIHFARHNILKTECVISSDGPTATSSDNGGVDSNMWIWKDELARSQKSSYQTPVM
jgi:hypothetical protein